MLSFRAVISYYLILFRPIAALQVAAIKNLFHFYSSPVALGQIYFDLVLVSINHNARYLYPEMDISRTAVGNEVVHQDEEVGGRGGGAVNPREIWHFQVFKCQFAHSWISNMSQIHSLGRTNTRSQDFMAALSIFREQLLGEKWYPQTLCTSPSERDIF